MTPAAVPGIGGGMPDHPPLPALGDELGLYRLDRWARAGVRASAPRPAERAAALAEIERQYRAALETELAEPQAGERPNGLKMEWLESAARAVQLRVALELHSARFHRNS